VAVRGIHFRLPILLRPASSLNTPAASDTALRRAAFPKLYLKIAVPSPLRTTFDYLPPENVPLPQVGMRVRVRFGRQTQVGFVSGISSESEVPADKLRAVEKVLDDEALLDAHVLKLYTWASDYYMYPLGQALLTSLPRPLREGKPIYVPGKPCWRLTPAGAAAVDLAAAPRQEALLNLLKLYGELTSAEGAALLGKPASALFRALEERGLAAPALRVADPMSAAQPAHSPPLTLNGEQAAAVRAIQRRFGTFAPFLLEGITGSGKTEVYLQLITQAFKDKRQVLLLVPEISLTPQTIRRFTERFQCNIVTFHSGLTDRQRCDGWLAARSGAADIVIGTRSAIFTPLPRLGLIIVDEEHDSSYKQQEGFRYSARDVAIYRARLQQVPIVLGSATPSLESLHNALEERYELLTLSQRAGGASLPAVQLLDLKLQELREGFSGSLLQAIRRELEQRRQVLVFLNRRGFAPLLLCGDCGWIAECPRCERSYTLHQHPAALRCHHCDAQKPLPPACPTCQSTNLTGVGLGTERSETLLRAQFPDFPVIRIDRDTTRLKGSLDAYMDRINSGEPCILVGTQMLAKGHHFPQVTLVAVLDADSGLFSADFRGQENLGQLLTQVSGRAGRSDAPGRVLIQTWHNTHPVLLQLVHEGYGSFARGLLAQRKDGGLPPFVNCLLLRAEAGTRELPLEFLQEARRLALQHGTRELILFGPMQSPLGKKAGHFRAQLILQAPRRSTLQRVGHVLVDALGGHPLARRVRWSVDVDPLDYS
jgi:primosomal protein N' (replication factor Y) (superfamily II helicase)